MNEAPSEITTVELYWRPGCPFSMTLQAKLRNSGLPVTEINIWEDSEAAARVRAVAGGNEVVPTVFVGEHAMVNPTMKQVQDAVQRHAPDLAPDERARTGLARFLPGGR